MAKYILTSLCDEESYCVELTEEQERLLSFMEEHCLDGGFEVQEAPDKFDTI